MLAPWEESYDKPRQCIKEQRYQFSDEGTYSQTVFFSSSHVWMWDLDHKEGWVLKKWCFQIVVLKKTLESPLDYKENKKVNPKKKKKNQPWIFFGKSVAEAEAPALWPPDVKSQFIRKNPDAGKDRRQRRRGW